MVSGSLSLPSKGFFSPFPHGTGTLSVSREYLALPDGPGGFAQDFTCPALLRVPLCRKSLRARGCHPPRRAFPGRSRSRLTVQHRGPTTPHAPRRTRFGLLPGRSPLLGESLLFSFPAGTKMFQFPALAPRLSRGTRLMAGGLSHSGIPGSQAICAYPGLFAAYHALPRLREPRHPPCALDYFLLSLDPQSLFTSRNHGRICTRGMKPTRTGRGHATVLLVPICQRSIAGRTRSSGATRGRSGE